MGDIPPTNHPTIEQFIELLRHALDHLYDPDQLPHSPLIDLFGLTNLVNASTALQDTLIQAIDALAPPPTTPAQSRAWRLHELLVCRYLQQMTAQEVADQLGLSRRHLRREQNAALEALAHRLWKQFGINAAGRAWSTPEERDPPTPTAATVHPIDEELSWLVNLPHDESAKLNEMLADIIALVQPLAMHNAVTMRTHFEPKLPQVAVHPLAVRQLLLGLFTYLIEKIAGGTLQIWVGCSGWEIKIQVDGHGAHVATSHVAHSNDSGLMVAERIAMLVGGALTLTVEKTRYHATVTLPALEQLPVLVIDDNQDALTLLQRYTKGTRYNLIGVQNPREAIKVAVQTSPQVIILDVMMPNIDGWELLGRLRQHPATRQTPIVVCSILAMESLALSLGANAYMQKPLTQKRFLTTLDQQIELKAIEDR